jgi:phage-related protein
MPTIGPGVEEIWIHTALEHRVIYIARFAEAVYVVHAFEKRSRKTPRRDLDLVRQRLQQLLLQRRAVGGPEVR